MTGGLCGYGVGRLIGEKAARRLLGDLDFEKGRLLFARGGGWMVALSRALPILPEALSCTAGLVRMPFARFAGALACGSLPIGFLFAWIGAAGRAAPGWSLAFSLLVPAALWAAARRWRVT
jgi:membrane protein DedA with SNARE-associated domain